MDNENRVHLHSEVLFINSEIWNDAILGKIIQKQK